MSAAASTSAPCGAAWAWRSDSGRPDWQRLAQRRLGPLLPAGPGAQLPVRPPRRRPARQRRLPRLPWLPAPRQQPARLPAPQRPVPRQLVGPDARLPLRPAALLWPPAPRQRPARQRLGPRRRAGPGARPPGRLPARPRAPPGGGLLGSLLGLALGLPGGFLGGGLLGCSLVFAACVASSAAAGWTEGSSDASCAMASAGANASVPASMMACRTASQADQRWRRGPRFDPMNHLLVFVSLIDDGSGACAAGAAACLGTVQRPCPVSLVLEVLSVQGIRTLVKGPPYGRTSRWCAVAPRRHPAHRTDPGRRGRRCTGHRSSRAHRAWARSAHRCGPPEGAAQEPARSAIESSGADTSRRPGPWWGPAVGSVAMDAG